MKIKGIILALLVLTVFSCKTKKQLVINQKGSAQNLQWMMMGSYDSALQVKEDSSFYNITLHMYPIWKDKGHFLYVEQAVASMPEKPYRQRIYEIIDLGDHSFSSRVYSLNDDDRFIGKWDDTGFFDNFGKEILMLREGCDVILKKDKFGYSGNTIEDLCKSTLRGASYATSKVSIRNGIVESWDQGFDNNGVQVWGAVKSGYQFIKKTGLEVR